MGDPIIHVRVGIDGGPYPAEYEMERIHDELRGTLEGYEVVVSTGDVDMAEVPALDDYADELANRIASKLAND